MRSAPTRDGTRSSRATSLITSCRSSSLLASVVLLVMAGAGAAAANAAKAQSRDVVLAIFVTAAILGYVLFFVVLGLVALFYYSAFYREAVGQLELGGLQFDFTARTWDWIKLWAVNIALVIGTLGVGYIFVNYRNYTFAIRHLRAYGEVRLDEMTQTNPPAIPARVRACSMRSMSALSDGPPTGEPAVVSAASVWHYDGISALRRSMRLEVAGDGFFLSDDAQSRGTVADRRSPAAARRRWRCRVRSERAIAAGASALPTRCRRSWAGRLAGRPPLRRDHRPDRALAGRGRVRRAGGDRRHAGAADAGRGRPGWCRDPMSGSSARLMVGDLGDRACRSAQGERHAPADRRPHRPRRPLAVGQRRPINRWSTP